MTRMFSVSRYSQKNKNRLSEIKGLTIFPVSRQLKLVAMRTALTVYKFGALFLIISTVIFLNTSASFSASTSLNATVSPGALSLKSPSVATISAVTLEGVNQTVEGDLGNIIVTDNRGSGSGWSVTIATSDFSCCEPARLISAEFLTVDPGMLSVISGKTFGVVSGQRRKFLSKNEPITLMTASIDSGMGSYSVSPKVSLQIPSDAYAGDYSATVTITVI